MDIYRERLIQKIRMAESQYIEYTKPFVKMLCIIDCPSKIIFDPSTGTMERIYSTEVKAMMDKIHENMHYIRRMLFSDVEEFANKYGFNATPCGRSSAQGFVNTNFGEDLGGGIVGMMLDMEVPE